MANHYLFISYHWDLSLSSFGSSSSQTLYLLEDKEQDKIYPVIYAASHLALIYFVLYFIDYMDVLIIIFLNNKCSSFEWIYWNYKINEYFYRAENLIWLRLMV